MSLAITLLSFIGIPPIAGFFAKQMILSAALDKNQIFLVVVAILTSVIGAAYYLNLIKQIFFYKEDYEKNPSMSNISMRAYIVGHSNSILSQINSVAKDDEISIRKNYINFKPNNITINSAVSSAISTITLLLLLFIFIPEE